MDVVLRHVLRSMPEHGPYRQFRESEFARDAAESVAKGMKCCALNSRPLANSPETGWCSLVCASARH